MPVHFYPNTHTLLFQRNISETYAFSSILLSY